MIEIDWALCIFSNRLGPFFFIFSNRLGGLLNQFWTKYGFQQASGQDFKTYSKLITTQKFWIVLLYYEKLSIFLH